MTPRERALTIIAWGWALFFSSVSFLIITVGIVALMAAC